MFAFYFGVDSFVLFSFRRLSTVQNTISHPFLFASMGLRSINFIDTPYNVRRTLNGINSLNPSIDVNCEQCVPCCWVPRMLAPCALSDDVPFLRMSMSSSLTAFNSSIFFPFAIFAMASQVTSADTLNRSKQCAANRSLSKWM